MPVGQTRILNGLLVMTSADGSTGTVSSIILIPR